MGGQGPVGVRGVYIHVGLHTRGFWFGGMSKKTTGCLNRHNKFFNPKPDKSKSVQYTPDEICNAKELLEMAGISYMDNKPKTCL